MWGSKSSIFYVTYKCRAFNFFLDSRCLKLYRAYSISFNSSNVGKFLFELNSKGLYQSSGKEIGSCCMVFPSSTKREIRRLHVVVVQRRLINVQKSVMYTCKVFALPI